MKEKLTNNLGLKIAAILFAASLWMISININDPYQSKDYSVEVQLQNMNVLNAAGKYVEVEDDSDKITVKVRGNRSVMDNFIADDIVAVADLKEIDENNRVQIKLSTQKNNGSKIESIYSNSTYVTVKVENIRKIQKNIEVITKNTPAKGYILGKTSTEQNALRISGPESAVNIVEKAVVSFDLEGAKSDVSMILPIELYDKNGHRINDERLTASIKEVQCVATILETKEVGIRLNTKGTVAKGYGFTGEIKSEPETVLIAGRNSVIKNMSEIEITEPIDIYNARENVVSIFDLKKFLPENVVLAASSFDGKVKATAMVEPEIRKIMKLEVSKIELTNVPENIKVEFADTKTALEIEVAGFESVISSLKEKELSAYVDLLSYMSANHLTDLEEGSYEAEVILNLPEGIWMEESEKVTVELVVE